MSRLTRRISAGNEEVIFYTKGEYTDTTAGEMRSSDVREVMRKLAEYEDLEEQGLLLKLPCKVGDTVWIIVNKGDYRQHLCEFEVTEISIKKINSYKKPRVHIGFIAGSIRRSLDTIGKTVFLTKEEAEQELKRLECA